MSESFVTVTSALETLAAGVTTISTPVYTSVHGTIGSNGTLSFTSVIEGDPGFGVTLVNDSSIGIGGSLDQFLPTVTITGYYQRNASYQNGVALFGAGSSFINNGTVSGNAENFIHTTEVFTFTSGTVGTTIYETVQSAFAGGAAGVSIYGQGSIVNAKTGLITGKGAGVYLDSADSLTNLGKIAGAYRSPQSYVETIAAAGTTSTENGTTGGFYGNGIFVNDGTLTANIDNSGQVTGGTGIFLTGSKANVTNQSGGLIEGVQPQAYSNIDSAIGIFQVAKPVYLNGTFVSENYGSISVLNAGTIEGDANGAESPYNFGIQLTSGIVDNSASGLISGYTSGIAEGSDFTAADSSAFTIINAGSVLSTENAAISIFTGTILNSGIIAASGKYAEGVDIDNLYQKSLGYVENSGSIIAGSAGIGISFAAGGQLVDSGSIEGGISFGLGHAQLELLPGAKISGSISGNDTYINASYSVVSSNNLLELGSGSTSGIFDMGSTVSGFETITFDPGSSWTLAGDAGDLAAGQMIEAFAPSDTIIVEGFSANSANYIVGSGLEISGGTGSEILDLAGTFQTTNLSISSDGTNTTITTDITGSSAGAGLASYLWIGGATGNWGVASNWEDVSTGADPATMAPDAQDSVTFATTSTLGQEIEGAGNSANLLLEGDNVLTGSFATGILNVSGVAAVSSGGTLLANVATLSSAIMEVMGTAALLAVTGPIMILGDGSELGASDGGSISLGSNLILSAASGETYIDVDGSSSIQLGAGTATAGALAIGNDATLALATLPGSEGTTIFGNVVNNGAIIVGSNGGTGILDVTGTLVDDGSILVTGGSYGASLFEATSLSGSGSIVTGLDGDVFITDLTGDVTVELGSLSTSALDFISGTGDVTVGADAELTIAEIMPDAGPIILKNDAELDLLGSFGAGSVIDFSGSGALLSLNTSEAANYAAGGPTYSSTLANLSGTLAGFGANDTLQINSSDAQYYTDAIPFLVTSAGYVAGSVAGTGMLDLFDGTTLLGSIALAGKYTGDIFQVSNETASLANITLLQSDYEALGSGLAVLHVGGSGAGSIAILNTSTLGSGMTVSATVTGVPSGVSVAVTASGAIEPQGSFDLDYTVDTSQPGTVAGLIDLAFANGAGAAIGTLDIPVEAAIYNYATAMVLAPGFTPVVDGANIVFDLGTFAQGTDIPDLDIEIKNSASGIADDLSGTLSVSSSYGFEVFSNYSFTALAAGDTIAIEELETDSYATGTLSETFVLSPTGSDEAGYSGALPTQTITVEAVVIAPLSIATAGSLTLGVGKTGTLSGLNVTESGAPSNDTFTVIVSDTKGILTATGAGATLQSAASAVDDFSLAGNPNGPWRYSATVNNVTTLLPTAQTTGIPGENYWYSGNAVPDSFVVGRNVSGATISYLSIRQPVDYLLLDPESAQNVSATYTAPVMGTYTLSGSFLGIDTNERSHPVAIIINNQVVFSGTVASFGQLQSFDLIETLAAGSTVAFDVDTGNSYTNLSTGLAATISSASGMASNSLTLTGSLAQVNADLATLTDTESASGTDSIALSARDSLGNTATASIAVTINGLPVLTAPSFALVGVSDGAKFDITLAESGNTSGELFTLSLADSNGSLSASGGGISGGGTSLTITGSVAQVNADLATLIDIDNVPGKDNIKLAVQDSFGNTAASTIAVSAIGALTLTVPEAMTILAGDNYDISGISLSEADAYAGELFSVILSDAAGTLDADSDSPATLISISGSLADVNAALSDLNVYEPQVFDDSIEVIAQDSLGRSVLASFGVIATDPLSIDVTSPLTISAGQPEPILGAALEDDHVVTGEIFDLTVSADFGTLAAGDGSDGSVIIFSGSYEDANSWLGGLTLTEPSAVEDTINIYADDSLGGSASASIDVTAGNALTIIAPAFITLVTHQTESISGVGIAEAGATSDETFIVVLTDDTGDLEADGGSGGGTALTITGSLGDINSALATLSDEEDIPGIDTIVISAADSLGEQTLAVIAVTTAGTLIINAPDGLTVGVNRPAEIPNVFLLEDDAPGSDLFFVTLSSSDGVLEADGGFTSGDGHLTIAGSLDDVNSVLASLTDTELTAGFDIITITANDSFGATAANSIALTVNGAPVISAPDAVTVSLGDPSAISGISLSETGNTDGESFTVYVSDFDGQLDADGDDVEGTGSASLTISGSLDDVNQALASLTDTETNPGEDLISISAVDSFDNRASPVSIDVYTPAVLAPTPVDPDGGGWGDTHLTSFDGLHYNFQAAGEFTLAANADIEVQARVEPDGGAQNPRGLVSFIVANAIKLGADTITVDFTRTDPLWIDGAPASLQSGQYLTLAGGAVFDEGGEYIVTANTGEQVDMTNERTNVYLDGQTTGVVGLLGNADGNQANDLALPDGTTLTQPLTFNEFYGTFANDWRVTDTTSLFNYGPGEDTATYTNLNFPPAPITVSQLPSALVQQAQAYVAALGITNPTDQQNAILDYILAGPGSVEADVAGSQGDTATNTLSVTGGSTLPYIAITGQSGTLSVGGGESDDATFTLFLTHPDSSAVIVDYSVLSDSGTEVGSADYGAALPSGSLTIAAGATIGSIVIAAPGSLSLPEETLVLGISTASPVALGNDQGYVLLASAVPVAGIAAAPSLHIGGVASEAALLSGSGTNYLLDIGTIASNGMAAIEVDLSNLAAAGGDALSGVYGIAGGSGFAITGLGTVGALLPGVSGDVLVISADLSPGSHIETVTLVPESRNETGYAGTLPTVTLTIEAQVVSPPAPGNPVLTAPATESLVAAINSAITGVSLAGTAGVIYTVKLTDHWDPLSATGTGISGAGSTALTISGSAAQVNTDLATLSDDPYEGADTITITAADSQGGVASPVKIAVAGNYPLSTSLVIVDAGQTADGVTVGDGGGEFLNAGARTWNIALNPDGVQAVLPGATTTDTIIDGGVAAQIGTAERTQVNQGGYQIIGFGGASVGANINHGAYEYVLAGGTATGTTIYGAGTMLVDTGGTTAGAINFAGSDAVLSVAGTVLPGTEINGFNQNNATDDAIILTGFTYAAGDTATLGAGEVLTLDLTGQIKTLDLNPAQSNAGHSFAVTTNSLDQVVIIDPTTGTTPALDFLAPATEAGSAATMSQILGRTSDLIQDIYENGVTTAAFQPALKNFAAIDTLDLSAAAVANLGSLAPPSGILSIINKLSAHPS